MFQLHIDPQAKSWAPTGRYLAKLQSFFSDPKIQTRVYLWPRHLASQVIGRPTKPYEFRAFTRGDESHIFVDDTETQSSIAWLLAHELCHRMVHSSPTLSAAFEDARPLDLARSGDAFHHIDSEERFCDGIATRLLGYRQDRDWWRSRVKSRFFNK